MAAYSRGGSTLRSRLAQLPKIELHRHLEGSLRLATLRDIAHQHGLDLPTHSVEELRPYVQVTNDEPNFRNFLDKFNVLRRFYQTPELIQRVAYEVMEDAAHDNLRYLELRFNPAALAKTQGYTFEEVTGWVLAARQRAQQDFPRMQIWLIASINRHEPLEVAERIAQIAIAGQAQGIVALDLAGDEVNFEPEPFEPLFQTAKRAGLGITVHAGEWTGAETVRHAVEKLGADRIGHGVRVVEDPAVAALARERGVAFEVCVTSNLQSGVIARLEEHPLRAMLALGLKITLNTDDPSVSDITLTDEYHTALEDLGLKLSDLRAAIITAATCIFRPPAERAQLAGRLDVELAQVGLAG